MDDKDVYLVKDLFESAFLYASNAKLINFKKDGSYYWLVFKDRSLCENLIQRYWGREASIDPKSFADALRSLKDRLFVLMKRDEYGKNKTMENRGLH